MKILDLRHITFSALASTHLGEHDHHDHPFEASETYIGDGIVGWRAWAVDDTRLHGITVPGVWAPRVREEAVCWRTSNFPTAAPMPGCTCGIYALKNPGRSLLWDTRMRGRVVIGRVHLWGRIVETTHGYRAQYAYPRDGVLCHGPEKLADTLSERYGVPILPDPHTLV